MVHLSGMPNLRKLPTWDTLEDFSIFNCDYYISVKNLHPWKNLKRLKYYGDLRNDTIPYYPRLTALYTNDGNVTKQYHAMYWASKAITILLVNNILPPELVRMLKTFLH
jgi:hypothetical protein